MSQRKPQLIISLHLIRSNYKKIIIYERLWSCTKVIRKRPHHRSANRQTLRSVNEQPKHKQCCSQDANLEWKLFFPFSTAFLRRNRNKRKCIINHISRASFIRLIEFPSSIFASTKNRDRMLCIAFWKRQIKMIFRNAFDDFVLASEQMLSYAFIEGRLHSKWVCSTHYPNNKQLHFIIVKVCSHEPCACARHPLSLSFRWNNGNDDDFTRLFVRQRPYIALYNAWINISLENLG